MTFNDTFIAVVPIEIVEDPIFTKWFEDLDVPIALKIESVISDIENYGLITSVKSLGEGLYEKKWHSDLRLYFAVVYLSGRKTMLLLGSGKGLEQDRAIKLSKKILSHYIVVKENIKKN